MIYKTIVHEKLLKWYDNGEMVAKELQPYSFLNYYDSEILKFQAVLSLFLYRSEMFPFISMDYPQA